MVPLAGRVSCVCKIGSFGGIEVRVFIKNSEPMLKI